MFLGGGFGHMFFFFKGQKCRQAQENSIYYPIILSASGTFNGINLWGAQESLSYYPLGFGTFDRIKTQLGSGRFCPIILSSYCSEIKGGIDVFIRRESLFGVLVSVRFRSFMDSEAGDVGAFQCSWRRGAMQCKTPLTLFLNLEHQVVLLCRDPAPCNRWSDWKSCAWQWWECLARPWIGSLIMIRCMFFAGARLFSPKGGRNLLKSPSVMNVAMFSMSVGVLFHSLMMSSVFHTRWTYFRKSLTGTLTEFISSVTSTT